MQELQQRHVSDAVGRVTAESPCQTCVSAPSLLRLYEPWEVLDDAGQPCTTFADFWQRWGNCSPSLETSQEG
jgi:hypothetical protein